MAKGFGIAALILAVLAVFVPVFGIYVSALAILCAVMAALAGDRMFGTATAVLALVNTFFLSPTTWIYLSGASAEGASGVVATWILLFGLLPFGAMILNATGKVALGR